MRTEERDLVQETSGFLDRVWKEGVACQWRDECAVCLRRMRQKTQTYWSVLVQVLGVGLADTTHVS